MAATSAEWTFDGRVIDDRPTNAHHSDERLVRVSWTSFEWGKSKDLMDQRSGEVERGVRFDWPFVKFNRARNQAAPDTFPDAKSMWTRYLITQIIFCAASSLCDSLDPLTHFDWPVLNSSEGPSHSSASSPHCCPFLNNIIRSEDGEEAPKSARTTVCNVPR